MIAIGERGRIDDDFAAPQAAHAAARPPAAPAASPAPLSPRPAITMPTPPQPSRAQVDALLSGMSRTAMSTAEGSTMRPPSAPAKPHVSGSAPTVPAAHGHAAAPPAASHVAPNAPGLPRSGFPFSHGPATGAPSAPPAPRPSAPPRAPTPAVPAAPVEGPPAPRLPNAMPAGMRPPVIPRPAQNAPAPSVGHAAPASAAPSAPPAGIPFAARPSAPPLQPPASVAPAASAAPAAPAGPAAPAASAAPTVPTPMHRATAPVQRPLTGGSRAPINPFLSNDPNIKAKRLARALVSDIVAYFPDKHREGLRNGTLRELFREEIKKSYEEYVDQMTREFAESTTHFQDALNDVLAGGKRIF
ncbi:MAG TPA: hypothetical protein VN607_07560 [Gemmatimonadaceae bacterium]|nr:hypothetical protein [Gemmatimonadaceae bacterium]